MRNPDYLPPTPGDPNHVDPATGAPDPIAPDARSDYDLPPGWTTEYLCNHCAGAVRRPLEGQPWPDTCSPACADAEAQRPSDSPLATSKPAGSR